jgi:uncharacterized protein YidB (DUF937 family)
LSVAAVAGSEVACAVGEAEVLAVAGVESLGGEDDEGGDVVGGGAHGVFAAEGLVDGSVAEAAEVFFGEDLLACSAPDAAGAAEAAGHG